MAKVKIIPPDNEQCQAELRSFMTHGPGFVRCSNHSSVIVTEKNKGSDGQYGSMSLCKKCYVAFGKIPAIKTVNAKKTNAKKTMVVVTNANNKSNRKAPKKK